VRLASVAFVVGVGMVGPAQYDQGELKPTIAATVQGPAVGGFRLGGIGLALRATDGPPSRLLERGNFDEIGLAVPLATYQRGRFAAQVGLQIQRANMRKGLVYAGVGVGR